jgi:hypothetical protein
MSDDISSAAVLLDALRRVMRHIPADWGGTSLSDDLQRAYAAIAKVEGNTNRPQSKPRHISYVCPQCHWSCDVEKQ